MYKQTQARARMCRHALHCICPSSCVSNLLHPRTHSPGATASIFVAPPGNGDSLSSFTTPSPPPAPATTFSSFSSRLVRKEDKEDREGREESE